MPAFPLAQLAPAPTSESQRSGRSWVLPVWLRLRVREGVAPLCRKDRARCAPSEFRCKLPRRPSRLRPVPVPCPFPSLLPVQSQSQSGWWLTCRPPRLPNPSADFTHSPPPPAKPTSRPTDPPSLRPDRRRRRHRTYEKGSERLIDDITFDRPAIRPRSFPPFPTTLRDRGGTRIA